MLPIQLLLFRDTGQDDLALGKVLGALVNLFTTLHGRMHEVLLRCPRLYSLLSMLWSLAIRILKSCLALVRRRKISPSPSQPGSGDSTAGDAAGGSPEVGGEGLRGRTRNKEGSSEEHRAALRSAIGHRSSSPSSPTSVTSVGEGDSGTVTIDETIDDTPTRGVPKRCSHLSFRDDRRCHLPALATSEFCELHHSQPCSGDRRRCPVCEVRQPPDAEAEHHCRDPDYGEELGGKGYYSRDCNSGPMLCVADSGERCDIEDIEWQTRVLRLIRGCDETNPFQLEVRGLDTTVSPPVRRHYVRVEAVASRVASNLEAATRKGVTDLVLVEYQCEGAGLSYAIAERITTSLVLSPDARITFLLVTNRPEGLPSSEACEAIESLRCGFTVAGVVVDLKDLCFNGLLQEFVRGANKPCIIVYSTHSCGADADLAVRSLSRSQGCTEERCASLVTTSCCHNLCQWSHFVGRAPWIRQLGLSHSDFLGCVEASAWATPENTPAEQAAVGRAATRLIDAARLIAVKESDDFSLWTDVKLYELRSDAEADGDLLLELVAEQPHDCS
ncbi:hypothetical protein FOZ63_031266 [Perkinsus olseni]|uniref:tRNA:m(4)X modification enzyme TRM13 n=1 Tax=Perkinsus olseni TaxID=32597 RepID=A0A7J6RMT5_PEROL|nr:hypothetical protein FOZ63_031266 [Perkinsus olseni]KAF4721562.1 hypothetical protein FOZ62_012517 [Perkinsus olseni]